MIFDFMRKAKEIFFNDQVSGLHVNNVQAAIDRLRGMLSETENKINEIANNQIPEEYLEAAVDEYVNNNSGGFATQSNLDEVASQLSLDNAHVNKCVENVYSVIGTMPLFLSVDDLENGSIDTNGLNTDATNRVRSKWYYPVKPEKTYIIKFTSALSLKMRVIFYTTNDYVTTRISATELSSENEQTIKIVDNCKYIRVLFATTDNEDFSPTDITSFEAVKPNETMCELIGELSNFEEIKIRINSVKSGNINVTNGRDYVDSTCIFTDEFTNVERFSKLNFDTQTAIRFYFYNENNEDSFVCSTKEWTTGNGVLPVKGNYMRVVLQTTMLSDFNNVLLNGNLKAHDKIINLQACEEYEQFNNLSYIAGAIGAVSGTFNSENTERVTTEKYIPVKGYSQIQYNFGEIGGFIHFYSAANESAWCGQVSTSWLYGSGFVDVTGDYMRVTVQTNSINVAKSDIYLGGVIKSAQLLNEVLSATEKYELRPKVVQGIAHRGLNSIAPENTLPAYKLAKKNGFNFVETDIKWTSDNVPVLLHDDTINATARNMDGSEIAESVAIADITFSEARTYDYGVWKSEEYKGTTIPSFEEFCRLCRNTQLYPYVSIKQDVEFDESKIKGLVDIARKYGILHNMSWVSSAGDRGVKLLRYVLKYDKRARVALSYTSVSGGFSESTIKGIDKNFAKLRTGCNEVFAGLSYEYLDDCINVFIERDIPVNAVTVDNENIILNINPYVTGIYSNKYNATQLLFDKTLE